MKYKKTKSLTYSSIFFPYIKNKSSIKTFKAIIVGSVLLKVNDSIAPSMNILLFDTRN